MAIDNINLYFLYAFVQGGQRHVLESMNGKELPFFLPQTHGDDLVFYLWHSNGKNTAYEFEYLYDMRAEFGSEVRFWFVNTTWAGENERRNAEKFAKDHRLDPGSILMDDRKEATATFQVFQLPAIIFVKRDNYVFRKLEGEFDEDQVRDAINELLVLPEYEDD